MRRGWFWGLAGVGLFWARPLLACPFCNVDGPATRAFLGVVFGTFFLSALFILLWAIGRAGDEEVEAPAHRMLEHEEAFTVRLHGGKPDDR